MVQLTEFATTITQNISDLQGQPWESKLLRMSFLVGLGRNRPSTTLQNVKERKKIMDILPRSNNFKFI